MDNACFLEKKQIIIENRAKNIKIYTTHLSKSIVKALVTLYLLCSLIVPSFFINKLIFVLIMVVYSIISKFSFYRTKSPFLLMIIFFYGFILSLVNKSDLKLARQFLLAPSILLLYYPCSSLNIDVRKIIKLNCYAILVVDFAFVLYGSNFLSISLPFGLNNLIPFIRIIPQSFFDFVLNNGEVAIGYRGFFKGIDIMVHLGSMPFLFFGVFLWGKDLFENKKYLNIIPLFFSLVAIIFSTSRALLIGSIVCLIIVFINSIKSKRIKKIISFSFAAIILISLVYLINNTMIFSFKEISNSIKIGHFVSFFDSNDILLFFTTGTGLGSYYYSSGVNKFIAHTEITFLDYCRYIGFPLTCILHYLIVFPFKKMRIWPNRIVFCAFVIYLIMSLTNPILMNSFGLFGVVWYWWEIDRKRKVKYE